MERIGSSKNLFGRFFWPVATMEDVREELDKKDEYYSDDGIMMIDEDGLTPLHYCAAYGRASMVHFLCEIGAKVNAPSKNGSTPLHMAAKENITNGPETIEALLDAGAEIEALSLGDFTPLHSAATRGGTNYSMAANIKYLISSGADITAKNIYGQTPLHLAALYGAADNIRALIEAGADPTLENKQGETPWDLTALNGNLKGTEFHRRAQAAKVSSLVNRLFGFKK